MSSKLLVSDVDRGRPARKLTPRFLGPFVVLKRSSANTHRLDFPPSIRAHPNVNVKFLRPFVAPSALHPDTPAPPPVTIDGHREHEVEAIIDHELWRGRPCHLVQWRGHSRDDSTWKAASDLANAADAIAAYESGRQARARAAE